MWSAYRPEPPQGLTEYLWSRNKRLSLLGVAIWLLSSRSRCFGPRERLQLAESGHVSGISERPPSAQVASWPVKESSDVVACSLSTRIKRFESAVEQVLMKFFASLGKEED